MSYVTKFTELEVYKNAVEAEVVIFELSRSFPKSECYSLTDQIRRSSRSVGAQIAEAWGKRRYQAHFVSKLTDADAEQLETQHWLACAVRSGYVTSDEIFPAMTLLEQTGRRLNSMMAKADQFCQPDPRLVREDSENVHYTT